MNSNNALNFEKPIRELEKKIQDLKAYSETNDVDVTRSVESLEQQIEKQKKEIFSNITPWQRVQLARHPERPYPEDYIKTVFSDFMEFHGDRRFSDDKAIFGGFAKLDDQKVMVIGTRKGRELKENVKVNFGSAHPEGYRKALRLMRMAEKARLPIISLIDTPGAYPGIGAEERHIAEAIAVNLREMFKLQVPIVVAIVGEGGSGGALGIGIGDKVMILENAYYSVITPEGCAAILWHDGKAAPDAADALKLTSKDLQQMEIVDEIIDEPLGGAHQDPGTIYQNLKSALKNNLKKLSSLSTEDLCRNRYDKFRKIGVINEE